MENPKNLDMYVATCQVGITISSLVLGAYGRSEIPPLISPWLSDLGGLEPVASQSISFTLVLLFLTGTQVLLGELVPKNIGIQYPERLAVATAIPMRWFIWLFRPLIWLFNGSGQLIMRIFGTEVIAEHTHIHAPEEIVRLVEESSRGGLIQQEERRLLKNTLEMRESMVRQAMIPRTRMITAPEHLTADELFSLVAESPFSRFPLFRGSIDNIVSVVHLKDLLCIRRTGTKKLQDITRPVPFVPETMLVKTVIALLQRRHLQVAIVLDEFGGTAGMVTLEDLIEEIFGELQDEFDNYIPPLRVVAGNRIWIRGDMLVADLNEQLHLSLPSDGVDTIGGLTLNAMGRVPSLGDEIDLHGLRVRVEKMAGRGVTAVSSPALPEWLARLPGGQP